MIRKLAVVAIAAAIALVGWGGVAWQLVRRRKLSRVPGEVIGHSTKGADQYTWVIGDTGGPYVRQVVRFQFQHRVHEVVEGIPSSPPEYEIGDAVTMLVPLGDPESGKIERWNVLIGFAGLAFVGFIFLIVVASEV